MNVNDVEAFATQCPHLERKRRTEIEPGERRAASQPNYMDTIVPLFDRRRRREAVPRYIPVCPISMIHADDTNARTKTRLRASQSLNVNFDAARCGRIKFAEVADAKVHSDGISTL